MKSSFDQRSRQLFTVVALSAVIACTDRERQDQRRSAHGRITYDYELVLPDKFKRQEVHGIDSKVEEWRSPDAIIGTDLGLYSSPPACNFESERCSISKENIAGKSSLVGRYSYVPGRLNDEQKPYKYHVHIPLNDASDVRLNVFAWCDTELACEEALSSIRKVRILAGKQRPIDLVQPGIPPTPAPPIPHN
jgi:hypothetical protein